MNKVFAISDNIYSPLGADTAENWQKLLLNQSAIKPTHNTNSALSYAHSSTFEGEFLLDETSRVPNASKLEQMLIASIADAVNKIGLDVKSDKVLLIFSTTKGNIDNLHSSQVRIKLFDMANWVTNYFQNPNKPIVISNACISGVLTIDVAMQVLKSNTYEYVIVTSGDIVSNFILSGFHSFQALSKGICKPFDQNRDGINLGEAAATLVLTNQPHTDNQIELLAASTSNDANHISGPSRTGEGLSKAIQSVFLQSGIAADKVQYVLTHGTATLYNDEMETKAIAHQNLKEAFINSLKSYYGHTLGAAGVLETIIAIKSMKESEIVKTIGYETLGVSEMLHVTSKNEKLAITYALKTASGFGGCNAALLIKNNG